MPGIPPSNVKIKLIQKSLESPLRKATATGGKKIANIISSKLIKLGSNAFSYKFYTAIGALIVG